MLIYRRKAVKNMDTEKFGKFIAACRMDNHMTQKELAQKLQVTDKAVSRWERGKGFPDISFLVPLSEALNISVPELMKSERDDTKREVFSAGEIRNVLTSASQMEKQNKKETRLLSALISPVTVIVVLGVVLLEKGSLLVGLWLGLAVALAVSGIVFLASKEAGRNARNVYSIFMLIGAGAIVLFLYLMGVDSLLLLCGLFAFMCAAVGAAVR